MLERTTTILIFGSYIAGSLLFLFGSSLSLYTALNKPAAPLG
jgi:hypothetical protein